MSDDRSREALGRFLDFLGEKGLLSPETARTRRVSALKLLAILSPEEAKDVTSVNMDDLMRRFHNLHGQEYNPGSLNSYKSRLTSSLADFNSYLDNPLSFKPAIHQRERVSRTRVDAREPARKGPDVKEPVESARVTSAPIMASSNVMPIPIRADLTILIHGLPHDLTEGEARKISGVINALAVIA